MVNKKYRPILISIFTYLLFFFPILNGKLTIYSGKDSTNYFYPSRFYLAEKLVEGEFPFWTERIFSGFPIYADLERGYLNPINIVTTQILGAVNSYKFMHFTFYLVGSYSLYLFLKRKKIGIAGFSVSNALYFFSFFLIYHQQHFNLTLTSYILPLIILLSDLFVEQIKSKYLIYLALVFALLIYLGNLQTVLILLVAQQLYFLANKVNFKKLLFYFILIAGLSLPILLPASELFLKSSRNEETLNYNEGSFAPIDLINLFYPFLYGEDENYYGTLINSDHLKHEMYIYSGIVGILLAVLGAATMKNNKLRRFLLFNVTFFSIIGFWGYVPFLRNILPPPFSFFRYWGRSALLLVFTLSIFAGFYIENIRRVRLTKIYNMLKPLLIYIFMLFIFYLFFFNGKNSMWHIMNNFEIGNYSLVWLALLLGTLVSLKSKKLLVILLFVDLLAFGSVHLNNAFITIGELTSSDRNYNKNLYADSRGYVGYTPLFDAKYLDYLRENGFENERIAQSGVFPPDFINSDLIKESVFESEGRLKYILESSERTIVDTTIRNYTGWALNVNSNKIEFTNSSDDLFLSFVLDEGTHLVELTYIPVLFYVGLISGSVVSVCSTAVLRKKYE